jgi:pimeloyl-ACP methyl ester carboxylesterase
MRFVLVHGGFHGAWCWSRVVPELQRLGHDAVAVDLPGHGARRDERSTLAGRRDAILDILEPGDVLVGHSAGGADITLAADAAPERVGRLVYLAAALPRQGRSLVEALGGAPLRPGDGAAARLLEMMPAGALTVDANGCVACAEVEMTREMFYHDCDAATVAWAFGNLSPSQPELQFEPIVLDRFWSADVARSAIVCLHDRTLPFAAAMALAGRLGVAPQVIEGSHSPFLSRPRELARLLVLATQETALAAPQPD